MPKPRVYVETTIPSFYYDVRQSPAVVERRNATRRWWAGAARRYALLTSTIVLAELAKGASEHASHRLSLVDRLRIVPFRSELNEVVEAYVRNRLMPVNPPEDAIHLALASWHRCDFLVTWNCRHLANPNKAVHIRRINTGLGIGVPRLVTPTDLLILEGS